ncbi:hypothetical protein A4X13_0g4334 [Tilletia indica]|uniref:Uncharacterized protein n=1 Tax=Tilletia indica TaxID=43049 RepID=A0A177TNC1_9BASI|nr:hypothetical protein A4X13_0g4334 [Tilletia indica]
MVEEDAALAPFQRWLDSHDVRLHPALYFAEDATCGMSIFTHEELPAGACAIDLPASLPITSAFSRGAIMDLIGIAEGPERERARTEIEAEASMNASDWVIFHLLLVRLLINRGLIAVSADGKIQVGMHQAAADSDDNSLATDPSGLVGLTHHAPYIQAIPYPEIALTPLHFNAAELNLLRGTSLYGATLERRSRGARMVTSLFTWLAKHAATTPSGLTRSTLADIASTAEGSEEVITLWRWADTAFGSRSFPPRVIGIGSEGEESTLGAVLIPGLDSFNHQRGRPVTWKYEPPEQQDSPSGRTMLILDSKTSANTQVFNNYGAKSVEELFGSYGFVIDSPEARQDDAIGLAVSSRPTPGAATAQSSTLPVTRHWWKYGATQDPPPALLDDIRTRLRSTADADEDYSAMTELDRIEEDGEVFEALEEMLQARLQSFQAGPSLQPPSFGASSGGDEQTVRNEVRRMVEVYRNGQETILNQAIAWCGNKLEQLEAQWSKLDGDEEGTKVLLAMRRLGIRTLETALQRILLRMLYSGKKTFFAIFLLVTSSAVLAAPHNPSPARPGENNEGFPDEVQLRYHTTEKVTRDQETGRLTTFLDGNYPPFEITHTRSEIDWDHNARYWGGSFSGKTEHGGADGRWLLSRTNGTIKAGFNGPQLGASPRVKLVYAADRQITFTIDGNGADLSCKPRGKDSSKWVCSGRAGTD